MTIPVWVLWTLGFGIGIFGFCGGLTLMYIGYQTLKSTADTNGLDVVRLNTDSRPFFQVGDRVTLSGSAIEGTFEVKKVGILPSKFSLQWMRFRFFISSLFGSIKGGSMNK